MIAERAGDPAPIRHPKILCLFAAAMGILEAIVVVYLRRIYYPDGFGFPLAVMDAEILRVELIREAMTLVMLAALAWLAAGRAWSRLMAFVIAFGVWDILYYVGLKLFLDWPVLDSSGLGGAGPGAGSGGSALDRGRSAAAPSALP